jgi:hypothetical protein
LEYHDQSPHDNIVYNDYTPGGGRGQSQKAAYGSWRMHCFANDAQRNAVPELYRIGHAQALSRLL